MTDEILGRSLAALQARHANQALNAELYGAQILLTEYNPLLARRRVGPPSRKVLVVAPCSNDQSWLYTPDTHQGEMWLKERAQLPLLQKELLCSALAAVHPGGVVVYSTYTMSCAENQSVVEAVLASYQGLELLDLEHELIDSLSEHFNYAYLHPSVGQLVILQKGKTWGPIYVSILRRIY